MLQNCELTTATLRTLSYEVHSIFHFPRICPSWSEVWKKLSLLEAIGDKGNFPAMLFLRDDTIPSLI